MWLLKKYNFYVKDFLERIIDCPDTDILKLVNTKNDLDFLLFDYPSYRSSTKTYLTEIYFARPGWASLATFERVLHRISVLELSDFDAIGLGDEIDYTTLKKLKEHAQSTIYEFSQQNKINNYLRVGFSYETKELRDLQLEVFRALWKATAYHEDDFFLFFTGVAQAFGYSKGFYTGHITNPGMLLDSDVMKLSKILDKFILEMSSSSTSLFNIKKLRAYLDAQKKLIQYQQLRYQSIVEWSESDAPKTWFQKLFLPSTTRKGYAYGFAEDPLYRGWAVSMDLFDLFGTEPISGISIPDAAFDVNDPLTYNLHHPSKNTMSIALYDQILTIQQLGIHLVYESMSETQQIILKKGLRELMLTGILKSESQVGSEPGLDSSINLYSGTDVKQWVTLADFKRIFPDALKFTFRYGEDDYT
ncbi:hypothetical protein LCGC14_2499730, partial [marine sediment metagenome]